MTGQTVSHYKILEKLGEGGMGVVYKAQDLRLDRIVALKFLPPSLNSPAEISRFQQEAKAISALNHASIATIFDVDQSDEQRFLALEYLPGGTLRTQIQQLARSGQELSLREIVEYGIQIAEGLAHAHRNGIIHRDVKTDNMMLTGEGRVKITDFGLAKIRGGAQLTRSGSTVGTTAYMSPEQVRGEELDHRTDLFSFGVVLFELAAGAFPFRGEHEAAVTYAITNEDPISLRALRPSIPPLFEQIVQRCLEKDVHKRYQSADDIIRDLRSLQSGVATTAVVTPPKSVRRWMIAIVVAFAAVAAVIFLWPTHDVHINGKSIAVLPFKNLSNDAENEYFSDGVTEEIIAQLSKIGDLKVISRTSVMQYKNTSKSIKQIARELGVATVLEGSVQKADKEVRIVAQLIDAGTDNHMWADTYDRQLTQIFAIQSDVADRIAAALQAKLSPSERERLSEKGTDNIDAYNSYLKAQFHWNRITKQDLKSAIEYYNDAIHDDPKYARAYAGLSNAYSLSAYFRFDFIPTEKAVSKARESALQALELDPNLAEAHTALGYILRTYDWNFPQAEQEFKKSIEIDPNYSVARDFYSLLLAALGRFDEAREQAERAAEMDPLSAEILNTRARVWYYARHYDEAIALARKELEVDPDSRLAHGLLGCIFEMDHMKEESLAEIFLSKSVSGTDYEGNSGIVDSVASIDWQTHWSQQYKIAEVLHAQNRLSNIVMAIISLRAGKREQALEWLQESYRKHEGSLVYLNVEPLFDPLRSEPRFVQLIKNLGLQGGK